MDRIGVNVVRLQDAREGGGFSVRLGSVVKWGVENEDRIRGEGGGAGEPILTIPSLHRDLIGRQINERL